MVFNLLTLALIGVSVTLFLVGCVYFPKIMRIQWGSVSSFVAFMVLITFVRIGIVSFKECMNIPIAPMNLELTQLPMFFLLLVGWEDLVFGFSIFLVSKTIKKPLILYLFIVISSLQFGILHGYQGWWAALILSLYPYFISYKYGLKCGFGTVIVCHIIYDFMTIYFEKFRHMLI